MSGRWVSPVGHDRTRLVVIFREWKLTRHERWGKFLDESPRALLPTLMAAADVIPFLKALLEHVCHAIHSSECLCAMPVYAQFALHFGMSTVSSVVAVILVLRSGCLAARALLDGCFAVVAPWRMLYHRCRLGLLTLAEALLLSA